MNVPLWVAQKIHLQAEMAYSIFKYTKLKSYDKKYLYLYLISFIPMKYKLMSDNGYKGEQILST